MGNGGTKDVEIIFLLKYISSIWRTLEITLINCEISLHLKWSKNFILVAGIVANQNPSFQINVTTLYVLVETLSIEENIKLIKQSGFKRAIN